MTFYPGETQLLVRELMEVDRLVAQIVLDEGGQKLATFNVKGIEQAASPIRDVCLPEFPREQKTLAEKLAESLEDQ